MRTKLTKLILPGGIKKALKEIPQWEYSDNLKEKVNEQIFRLWVHTRQTVPYYFENSISSFYGLPFLTRQILNENHDDLISAARRRYYINRTGGSSGEPVKFIQDRYYDYWNIATKIYYKLQAGQEPGDLECRIWGIDNLTFLKRLLYRAYNRKEFQGFCLNEREIERYARWIQRYKPAWIEAYTDSMVRFCKSIKGTLPSPKGVLVSGGMLYPQDRKLIESTFNCPVFNRYGSREVGAIACDCPKGRMHVSSWHNYIEIIEGKICVTNLRNFSQPFLRYYIGDMASGWGTCDCGRRTPVIKGIEGRLIEMFKTKDGRHISGIFLPMLWGVYNPKKEVKEVQAIQKDYDHIVLNVVLYGNERPDMTNWYERINNMMGGGVFCETKFVDELERLPSGKIPYTLSKVEWKPNKELGVS